MKELLSEEFASKLERLAKENAEKYRDGKPFPHIYFDDFLPVEAAEAALRDFPEPKELKWQQFDNPNEKKLAFDSVERLPTGPREALFFLNSRPMIQFLEVLTGIKGVIPDPYYVGGGLHQIKPGGKLGVHADFNHHAKLNLERRINVLVYLNKDWKEEYDRHFELWDKEMTHAEQKILPLFNRSQSSALLLPRSTAIPHHSPVRPIARVSRLRPTTIRTAGPRKNKTRPIPRSSSHCPERKMERRNRPSKSLCTRSRLLSWPTPSRVSAVSAELITNCAPHVFGMRLFFGARWVIIGHFPFSR